jgi:uncharacterized protein YndB with AHSA1/START domain
MAQKFSNKKTAIIHAPVTVVWQALTDPALIKQYFFGVDAIGEWKEGNTIVHKGEWQGKKFIGKAKVLQLEDEKLLKHSYWSDMSGQPDEPSYYHIITYQLAKENDHTKLILTEENLATEEMKEKSGKLWDVIFDNLKKLLEKEPVK